MELKLSKDKEHLVLENRKLVFYVLKMMCIPDSDPEHEDFRSIGEIGLMKAAIYFDENKGKKFSTYATYCIRNEIWYYLRQKDTPYSLLSLDAPISYNDDNSLEDFIEDIRVNLMDDVMDKEIFISAVNIILNCFYGRKRLAMLYHIGCLNQIEIARRLKCGRGNISLALKTGFDKLRQLINKPKRYKKTILFSNENDCYQFSFVVNDIKSFQQTYALLQKDDSLREEIPINKIIYQKERAIVKMQATPEAFLFIARLIQEMNKDDIEGKKKMKD